MTENRFLLAGWAAIAAAGLMPVAFIVAGLEQAAFDRGLTNRAVGLGVADYLLLVFGAVAIYVLLELKRMLFERYSHRSLDVIIMLAIAWTVVNYGGSFALQSSFSFFSFLGPKVPVSAEVVTTVFWIVCIGVFGIIDAILGIMLLVQGRRFGIPLLVFAAFSLAMGLCELTVVLSIFGLVLFPIAYISLGVAFLRPEERLEFV